MTFNLTTHDQDLLSKVSLAMSEGVNPVSGFPGGGREILFQFPPIIKNESKKLSWIEKGNTKIAYEPIYYQLSAFPREISLSATYIVGGPSVPGVETWTPQVVAQEVRQIKSYFYNNRNEGKLPVFLLTMYQHALGPGEGGMYTTTWRATGVDFKFSDTLVTDSIAGTITGPENTFPLRTDVTLKLSLTTRIKNSAGQDIFEHFGDDPPDGGPGQVMPQTWY